jgi:two-component system NarL family response regulator
MTEAPTIGTPPRIRVLIADDHVTVREGLAAIIGRQGDMVVVAEAATGTDAIALWRDHRPDVTLMDLRMPGLDGVGAMMGICAVDPSARIVVLTTFDSDHDMSRAITAGAKGYLLKDAGREDVLECIRSVHAGNSCLPPRLSPTASADHQS